MQTNFDLDKKELKNLMDLIHESLRVRTHFEFFLWLQGKLQYFLPHEIMIAAWGDFALGLIYFDIVSPLPGVRTGKISAEKLNPLLKRLFTYWSEHSRAPFAMTIEKGIFQDEELKNKETADNFTNMHYALVHAIKDHRGRHDCLYVLLSPHEAVPPSSRRMLELLLPYIDSTLRQLEHLPEQLPEKISQVIKSEVSSNNNDEEIIGTLSIREIDIMQWVKSGKTNLEIGQILDISAFTVKNHLQRIFKKLDVMNRAQAVTKYQQMYAD